MELSPFSRLPPELRNKVYQLVFTTESSIIIQAPDKSINKHHSSSFASLTRVCKQTRDECFGMMFFLNNFTFPNTSVDLIPHFLQLCLEYRTAPREMVVKAGKPIIFGTNGTCKQVFDMIRVCKVAWFWLVKYHIWKVTVVTYNYEMYDRRRNHVGDNVIINWEGVLGELMAKSGIAHRSAAASTPGVSSEFLMYASNLHAMVAFVHSKSGQLPHGQIEDHFVSGNREEYLKWCDRQEKGDEAQCSICGSDCQDCHNRLFGRLKN